MSGPVVVIACGGTGGHIYPGVATAEALTARGAECRFVITGRPREREILEREGLPYATVPVGGLRNLPLARQGRHALGLPLAGWRAWRLLGRWRPRAVVGTGAYPCGPVVLAAYLRGIPTLLLEQNRWPGLTVALLAPLVDAVGVAFAESAPALRGSVRVTGNPVRRAFYQRRTRKPDPRLHLLVFGGSAGARPINRAVTTALPFLDPVRERLAVVHQTGEADLAAVRADYAAAGWEAEVIPYLWDLPRRMHWAHLVCCRAGATTVAELLAARRAAVLVPFPLATDAHQTANARLLADRGAAVLLPQAELTGPRLAEVIRGFVEEPARAATLESRLAADQPARPAAAVSDLVWEIIEAHAQN